MIDLKDLKENFNLEATFSLGTPKEYVGKLDGWKEVLDRIDLVLTQTFDAIGTLPFRQLIVQGKDKKVVIIYYRNNFFGIVARKDENVEEILKYIYEKGSILRVGAKAKEKKAEEEERKRAEEEERKRAEEESKKKAEEEAKKEVEEKDKKKAEEAKKKAAEEKKAEEEERKKAEEEARKKAEEEAKKKAEEERKKEEEKEKEVSVPKVILSSKIIDGIEEIAGKYLGDFSLDIVSNVMEDSEINRKEPTKDQVLEVAQSLKDAASLIIGPSKAKKLKEDIIRKIEEEK